MFKSLKTSKLIQRLNLLLTILSTSSQRTTQKIRCLKRLWFLLKNKKKHKKRRRSSSMERKLQVKLQITTISLNKRDKPRRMLRRHQLKLQA